LTKECFADLARIYNSPEDRLQQVKGNLNYQTEMTKSRQTFETILLKNGKQIWIDQLNDQVHLALYFHAPGYQRGIAVRLGCQILAKVTFQCYFGSKSPAKTNMLMGSNTIGGYRSKNCTTLFAFWTNLRVHVQPEFYPPPKIVGNNICAHAVFSW